MNRIVVLAIFLTVFVSCTSPDKPSVSFYYWKTVFQLTEDEKKFLDDNEVSTLYIRYFDVALRDNKPVPLSALVFKEKPGLRKVIPVVYIKNEVMLQQTFNIDELAGQVVSYIEQINAKHAIENSEIQLDCDWTLSSKEKYFRFVDRVKLRSKKTISATIRLHQIKYLEKTGIPKVDKGVLMYYNMGHISADSSNSIYDRKTAQRYISSLNGYPLPLNVALPIFSWGQQIRSGRVIGLLNKVDNTLFKNDTNFIKKEPPFFEARNNVIKAEYYFQRGDRVKIESVSTEELEEMANDLSDKMNKRPQEIIFYDFDTFNLRHYAHEKNFFKKIAAAF